MKRGALLLAAAGALLSVSATSAAISAHVTVDFLQAPVGPASAFHSLPIGLTARARLITNIKLEGRDRVLLVAPATGGGYCESLSGPYGGTGCIKRRSNHIEPGLIGDQSGPILFHGSFTSPNATRLELTYQDGTTSQIPFIWVSKPVSAGFFVFQVSDPHRRQGARPRLLSLFDRGSLVAQTRLATN